MRLAYAQLLLQETNTIPEWFMIQLGYAPTFEIIPFPHSYGWSSCKTDSLED